MFAKAAITGTLQAGTTTFDAEYLVVAGGGGGGDGIRGGGGGAGGYRSSVTGESSGGGASAEPALSIALGTPYTVTVGSGGASEANGSNSALSSIVSTGGGRGGNTGGNDSGSVGGSGGGAGVTNPGSPNIVSGSSGTANQGFAGGDSETDSNTFSAAGGGGGAGENGTDGSQTTAGDGGDGIRSSISGTPVFRAGGGGGTHDAIPSGVGGAGGGGNAGSNGTINTGGGGGDSAAGGSGVVIIRVPSEVVAEFSAGVVYNYIPQDDFNVYEITAAGASDTVTFSQGEVTTVENSLRFNDDDSAYLDGTYSASATNTKATFAFWYKSGFISASQMLYQARDNNSVNNLRTFLQVAGGTFRVRMYNSAATQVCALNTTRVFRDPSAWYHLVFQLDTTQATASDRVKLYVNGVLNTDFSVATTYPPLNFAFRTVSSVYTDIGRNGGVNTNLIDGYLSDYYFIDGEAHDASRFGKQDADGVWQPITYTGTYGTNGFHLDFADNSTAAALGTDVSGNGNDWTPSGITTDDQVADTPSVNYATWNPLVVGNRTFANGNLDVTMSASTPSKIVSTFGASSGKYYMEYIHQGNSNWPVGISADNRQRDYLGMSDGNTSIAFYCDISATAVYINGSSQPFSGSGTAWVASDIVGVALDADNEEVLLYKNGVLVGSAVSYASYNWAQAFFAAGNYVSGNQYITNFGQRPFAYTPPTGFQALNSSNLPAPTITDGKEHFQPVLYTGNGTSQTVRGLEFQPDLVWIKNRDAGYDHWLQDAVRGAQKQLQSSTTNAETSYGNVLASFETNGFAVNSSVGVNASGQNHVAWNWNAGGSTVTNTDGSITSQVRANTDAGFSIVSYTGNGIAGATVGHGLGAEPEMLIIKQRNSVTGRSWPVYHKEISASNIVYLNLSNASLSSTALNNTAPSSSVITLGSVDDSNGTSQSNTYIAYCFAGVDGFSKFGSYTGNGSTDGPFVYTGFRPAFVMVKKTNATQSWAMMDNKRTANYNDVDGRLFADLSNAEATGAASDFLSNGFKLRGTQSSSNGSGDSYIYMAFAENPFKTARAR
jgi:hypothetical protein